MYDPDLFLSHLSDARLRRSGARCKGYIKRYRHIRIVGTASLCCFVLLSLLVVFPIVRHTDFAEATFVPSTTSITIATGQGTANVDITPVNASGTFAKSDSNTSPNNTTASFDVTTNNYTGYTLKLLGSDATGNLTNASYSDTLASITSAIDQSTFESGSSYTNKWGIKPSVVNSASNTDYYPAPTTTSEIPIETTSTANSTAKNYNINVGAKVDYTKAAGTYNNTFTLVAVGNATSFVITYDTGDVTDVTAGTMPANPTQGSTGDSYVTLDPAVPQRTGYTFAGWCNGTLSGTTANPGTTCTGTLITDGKFDLNQTTSNTVALHATWIANKYTCTKQYRLQAANASFPTSYTSAGTEQVAYNNVCSYSYDGSDKADYKPSASGTNGATVSGTCTITTSGCTVSLDLYRNTYALTVSRNTSYLSNATGGGIYRWGQEITVAATTNYSNFTGWSVSSGSSGSFANASTTSTTYTMPKGDSTVYANGDRPAMNSFTKSTCQTRASSGNIWLYDARDNQYYTARYINGGCWMTRNIAIGCNGSGASYNTGRTSRTLNNSNSNVDSGRTWNTPTLDLDKNIGTTNCTTSNTSDCSSYTTARIHCEAQYAGAWYNYVAATAGQIYGSANATTATNSVCPAGWRLPNATEITGITSYMTQFAPAFAGFYNNGNLNGPTRSAIWWSSVANSTDKNVYRFGLTYDGSSLTTTPNYRYIGLPIRCVRT